MPGNNAEGTQHRPWHQDWIWKCWDHASVVKWADGWGLSDVDDVFVRQTSLKVNRLCSFKLLVMSTCLFKKWLCVSSTIPEARRICLVFDVWIPRQIQDIYSGMPRGHTVGGDVVAVRAASLPPLPPSLLGYDFAPLFSASCFFFFAEKRRGCISNPIPAQFMNVTVTHWTALTSARVKAY